MKRRTPILVTGVALAVIMQVAIARNAAEPEPPKIEDLAWLAGSWTGTLGAKQWEACYTTPAGGEILSVSKEIRDGRVAMIEFERFQVVAGQVVMRPYPFGRKSEVAFMLVDHDGQARRAEFANPLHDFPQRLIYHRTAHNRLKIEIIGTQGGKPVSLKVDLMRR